MHGSIVTRYLALGEPGSWLGYPVGEEFDIPGGRRAEFENGFIVWDRLTGGSIAMRDGAGMFSVELDTNRAGIDFLSFPAIDDRIEVCRDACAAEQSWVRHDIGVGDDYAVNCREYYADRLTVAILNEQARADQDMLRWRTRYLELVEAMGETIPDQYRCRIPDFAALDADCALIDVAQPTPETMQPYASAYFERYRLLLEADLPPMASVFQTHLSGRWDETHKEIPFAPSREGLELATLAQLDEVSLGTVYGDDTSSSAGDRTRVAAFDPSGKLWFASLSYDRETRLVALYFGAEPKQDVPILAPAEWHQPTVRLEVSSLAVLSADRFLVSLQHWDNGGIEGMERHFVTFVLADHVNDFWTLTSVAELEDMQQAAVLRSPSDKLYMIASPDPTGPDPTTNWIGFEISLERGDVVAQLPIGSGVDFPLAIDDDGRIYEELGFLLWQSEPGGGDTVLVGNGHIGPRDGIGAKAEISDVQVLQFMPDGRALFIDRDPRWDAWQLRELRPLQ